MKKSLLVCLLVLPALGMSGDCDALPGGDECPGDDVPAISLKIVDGNGDTLDYAEFRVSYEGSSPSAGACDGNCDDINLGFDLLGTFQLSAWSPGYTVEQKTVEVEAAEEGGCHPDTENVVLVLEEDETVAALIGAWRVDSFYHGSSILYFGGDGQIVGAVLLDRVAQGDGNIYIAYNGYVINGVSGSLYVTDSATDPTRTGDKFDFTADTMNFNIGFQNAVFYGDFNTLVGTLAGTTVTYVRLSEVPTALQTQ